MQRQRCVVHAVVDEADPVTLLRRFDDLVAAVIDSVLTDIPISRLPELIDLLAIVDTQHIVGVSFVPPTYWPASPNRERIRSAVEAAFAIDRGAVSADHDALGVTGLANSCSAT